MGNRARLCLLAVGFGAWACAVSADVIEIAGPDGPLQGEAIVVDGADHVVVIIPGSGPVDRDGNASAMMLRSDTYKLLAEGLAEVGIASIRIDKRGNGGSAFAVSDPSHITIEAYAQDARNWAAQAVELAPCVWLAGHSEGALVALVAATLQPPEQLCGLILMAGPGRPVGTVLREQLAAMPQMAPFADDLDRIIGSLETGNTVPLDAIPEALWPMFAPGTQRYMADLFRYDPVDLAALYDGPVLILQGDQDLQVKMTDADLLQGALVRGKRHDLLGATHMLKPDVAGQPFATYTSPDRPLHPELIPAIVDVLAAPPKP